MWPNASLWFFHFLCHTYNKSVPAARTTEGMGCSMLYVGSQMARFMGPTWGQPGSCRPQMGPMLAPWTLLSDLCMLLVKTKLQLYHHNKHDNHKHAKWYKDISLPAWSRRRFSWGLPSHQFGLGSVGVQSRPLYCWKGQLPGVSPAPGRCEPLGKPSVGLRLAPCRWKNNALRNYPTVKGFKNGSPCVVEIRGT